MFRSNYYVSWSNQWRIISILFGMWMWICLHVHIESPNENFQCLAPMKTKLTEIIHCPQTVDWGWDLNCPSKWTQYALFVPNIYKFTCVVWNIFSMACMTLSSCHCEDARTWEKKTGNYFNIKLWYIHTSHMHACIGYTYVWNYVIKTRLWARVYWTFRMNSFWSFRTLTRPFDTRVIPNTKTFFKMCAD